MTCGPEGCRDPLEPQRASEGDVPRRRTPTSAATWTTMAVPGAISVLQLVGDIEPVLRRVAGAVPDPGQVILTTLAGVDTGVIARVNHRVALLMPHGGVRIRERLESALLECGVMYAEPSFGAVVLAAIDIFPEAEGEEEARVLEALARAASPIAMTPLMREAARAAAKPAGSPPERITAKDIARGERLWRLVEPARVAIVGAPNVGKSTLLNRVSGQDLALSGPEPGLTRDAVAARIDLSGLVVDWFDTPGLRHDADPIEREALAISEALIRSADVVLALAEPGGGWPAVPVPHMRILNKSDLPAAATCPEAADAELRICAKSGAGLDALVRDLRERLVPAADLEQPQPWVFPRDTAYRPMME